jgi:hypothetical protein
MNQTRTETINQTLVDLISENGYNVKTIGHDIEVSGKVILPTIRRMLEVAGYRLTYNSYKMVVGSRA